MTTGIRISAASARGAPNDPPGRVAGVGAADIAAFRAGSLVVLTDAPITRHSGGSTLRRLVWSGSHWSHQVLTPAQIVAARRAWRAESRDSHDRAGRQWTPDAFG